MRWALLIFIGAAIGGAGVAAFKLAQHLGADDVLSAVALVVVMQTLGWAVKRTAWWRDL